MRSPNLDLQGCAQDFSLGAKTEGRERGSFWRGGSNPPYQYQLWIWGRTVSSPKRVWGGAATAQRFSIFGSHDGLSGDCGPSFSHWGQYPRAPCVRPGGFSAKLDANKQRRTERVCMTDTECSAFFRYTGVAGQFLPGHIMA